MAEPWMHSREFWRCIGEEDAKCAPLFEAKEWERLDRCLEQAERRCLERLGGGGRRDEV